MDRKVIVEVTAGALVGLLVATAIWSRASSKAEANAAHGDSEVSAESLRAANDKLVESQHEADKVLADLRAQVGDTAAPPPSSLPLAPFDSLGPQTESGARLLQEHRDLTKEQWADMIAIAAVRYTIPCLRKEPWTPSKRQLDHMGLAPQDVQLLQDAYEHSNKRLAEVARPLCAKVIGSADAVDLVGAKSCVDSVLTFAKTNEKEATDKALISVAQTRAGKTAAKPDVAGVEKLLLALTGELKTFEAELAAKLGPEEARRLTTGVDLCIETGFVRARAEGE